tara:strand:- start:95 stop:691 length:597 start_codon:yes stop_codon:yes gene_type:complete
MKIFLAILVLIISFQSLSKADDIKEFEIEGVTIGDILLDHSETLAVTKDSILNQKFLFYPKSKKFGILAFEDKGNFNNYYKVQFTVNPKDYKIYKIGGYLEISDKRDCAMKQKSIIEDLIKVVPSAEKIVDEFSPHPADKTGESIASATYLVLPSNDLIEVACYLWGKKISNERGWEDNLRVNLSTKTVMDFINNEAY